MFPRDVKIPKRDGIIYEFRSWHRAIVLKRFDEERSAGIIVTHSVTQKTIRAYVPISTVAMLHKHKRSET